MRIGKRSPTWSEVKNHYMVDLNCDGFCNSSLPLSVLSNKRSVSTKPSEENEKEHKTRKVNSVQGFVAPLFKNSNGKHFSVDIETM